MLFSRAKIGTAVLVVLGAFVSGGRADKPLPPTQAETSRSLDRDLAALMDYRHGSARQFTELEEKAAALLKKYPGREDRARIEFQVAHVAAQSDILQHVERVQKYGRSSLAGSRDPLLRSQLYTYLGSAAEVDPRLKTFAERRRKAAGELLRGYAELLALRLPKVAPELPPVGGKGAEDPNQRPAFQARQAAQLAARRKAESLRALVAQRDILANQLKWLYQPHPKIHGRNPEGPAELRPLALSILNDSKAVDALIVHVTAR